MQNIRVLPVFYPNTPKGRVNILSSGLFVCLFVYVSVLVHNSKTME